MTSARFRYQRFGALFLSLALLAAACTSTDSSAEVDGDREATDETGEASDGSAGSGDETGDSNSGGAAVQSNGSFSAPVPDLSLIEISDDIRMGVLDNGLTYFVQSNDSPGGSVSLRLAVAAGGLHEDPVGTGAAHFLEHMMFNGTERFPGGSLDATLRSIGAEIGPDFNAFTSETETVYQLQIADQGDNVSIAFDVLAEWAAAALIEPDEVAAEAPVVREEFRVRRESGGGIINEAFTAAYFADTPFESVNVSGTAETINATTAEDLRAFYDTWYRPDNMAIIAVGDRSLDDLEDQIVDRFSDLTARGEIIDPPVVGDFELRTEPLVDVVIEPSFPDSFISVDIPVRSWDRSTEGGNELLLTEIVLGIAIDNRIREGVDTGRLDLRRGGGGYFPRNRDLAYVGFNVDADDLVAGTEVIMTELQGSLQNPFTENELERAADVVRTSEEQRLAGLDTRQDNDIADLFVSFFTGSADLAAVPDSVERNLDILDDLDVEQANAHWGWLLTNSAPIVLVVGPDADRVGARADHLAAIEAASVAVVDEVADDIAEIDVLVEAPDPVREIESNDLVNGDVELVFANGHRVLFVESTISEGQLILSSESPGGRSALSASDGPLAPVALNTVASSGVGPWEPTQLRRYLADIDAFMSPVITDFSEGFSGGSSTEDAETMFQLLHLMVTGPRVDDVPFEQQVEINRDFVARSQFDSGTATALAASDLRSGGGRFAAAPTPAQLDSFTEAQAEAIYTDRFSSLDAHTIVIVGDIDEDDLVDLARAWIGTLPAASGDDEVGSYPDVGNESERLSVGSGTAGGSFFLIATGPREATVENQVVGEVVSRIIDDRIFTVIREELGASYGGFSFNRFAEVGDGVDLVVSIDGDPGRIDEIADTVNDELVAIANGETSESDFAEAISVFDSELNFINNSFLIEMLFDEANSSGGVLLNRRSQREALESVSADDIASFVDEILTSGQRVDVRNIPG